MALLNPGGMLNQDRRFLDRLFTPLRTRRLPPTRTEGVGGVAAYGGHVVSPEKNPQLVGRQRYLTFSEMLANTSIIAAGTRYFLNLVAKAEWKVEPADGSGAEEVAELVEDMLNDMATPWPRAVRRAAMYRFHGFSIQEWTAKRRDDGLLGLMDLEPRPQVTIERWDLDASGTVHGVVQSSPQDSTEIYLPRAKLLYLVDDSLSDSPEGLGLFRHLVDPYQRLKRFELLEAYGYETDLRGIPIGRAPAAVLEEMVTSGRLSRAQATEAVASLRRFIENHTKNPELGLVLDSLPYRSTDEASTPSNVPQWDLQLLRGEGTGTVNEAVSGAISRLNLEMATVLGVEGLLLGSEKVGSLALSRDKSHNFALIVDSSLAELRASVSKDVVDVLMRLNGWDPALKPELKTEATRYRDVEEITGALRDMAQAGAILAPDDPAISEVRELMGLSRSPEVSGLADASLMPGAGTAPVSGNEEEIVATSEEMEQGAGGEE